MLPGGWEKKLVDMNVSELRTNDLVWADYVFISAMYIQKESVNTIIAACRELGVKMVAGGPLFTQEYNNYPHIDHFVLNEAELTLPPFLKDLEEGHPARVYKTDKFADLTLSPVPDYHLLQRKKYALMNLQVSRGCPYACDFCEITSLLGHRVRMKQIGQVLNELEALYRLNWRGAVSVVDDNFIGNKKEIKTRLLPGMRAWMKSHRFPFVFNIQSSINLADDPELMSLLVQTGFNSTFIGIETPDAASLHACNKLQNENRDMVECVQRIQGKGIQVSAGFIVGFDSDTPDVFQRQIDFIQKSGIVTAMVGLLNAPKNTRLYHRLKKENRLTTEATGNNTDLSMNFIPKMNYNELIAGYKTIVHEIYTAKPFYKRLRKSLLSYRRRYINRSGLNLQMLGAFFKSVFIIGIVNKGRLEYWKLLIWTLFNRPGLLTDALTLTVYGYHFRTIYGLQRKNGKV